MNLSILLNILVPLSSPASEYCTPIGQIEPLVNYCHENSKFVAPAEACRDRFRDLVKSKNEEIKRNFAQIAKASNMNSQSGDMATMQKLLASTETTLDNLIAQGKDVYAEAGNYQEDFVLPIYEGYEEDFAIDPHTAKGQAYFRDMECYGLAMEDIDNVKADVRKMVNELEKTREQAKKLHAITGLREEHLENGADTGKIPQKGHADGGAKPSPKGGKSQNKGSDITGTDEAIKNDNKNR